MNGDRFDELTRLVARLSDRRQSRRSVLRAVLAGSSALATGPASVAAVADRRRLTSSRNQVAGVNSLIDEIAFQLEYDVQKIFRFVTDEIKYQSYQGALRGPIGTLWSGAGNSVDQAQLLKALLDASRIRSRFAIGTLGPADSSELLASSSAAMSLPALASEAFAARPQASPVAPEATPVFTPAEVNEAAERLGQIRSRLFEVASRQVDDDATRYTDLLTEAGLLSSDGPASQPPAEPQHVWVTVDSGTERIDLDPSFAGATPGTVRGTVHEPSGGVVDALPDDVFHTVAVRLRIDSRSGDHVVSSTAIDQTFRSQDLVGQNLMFTHIEPQSLKSIGYALQEAFEGTVAYYGILVAGSEVYLSDAALKLGSGGGLFDDVLGDAASGVVDGEAVAEYLEVEVSSPGHDPVRASRTIFNRLIYTGTGESRALDQVPPIEVTEIGDGEKGVLPIKQVIALASVASHVPDQFLAQNSSDDVFPQFSGAVHAMHGVRQRLQRALPSPLGLYPDRPNVSALVVTPIPNPDGKTPNVAMGADLIVQSYGGDTWQVTAGVAAQAAEDLFLDREAMQVMFDAGILPTVPGPGTASAGQIFREAVDQGIALSVIKPSDSGASAVAGLDPAARALIAAHLDAGRAVIIPAQPVQILGKPALAWWVFDPATGKFWDELPDGRSGSMMLYGPMGEYAIELWTFTKTTKGFVLLSACIYAVMQAVGGYLNAVDSTTAGNVISFLGAAGASGAACTAYLAVGAV